MSKSEKISQQVKAGYNKIAGHFSQTRQAPWEEFKLFKEYIKPGMKILDLGCGNGRLYKFLKDEKIEVDYYGLDNSEEFIKICQKQFPEATSRFQIGDMAEIKFPEAAFDIVICIASFHHLSDKKVRLKTLTSIKRVLKKNGYLFMTNWHLWLGPFKKHFFNKFFNKKSFSQDFYIPWKSPDGQTKTHRFYHSFTKPELKQLHKKTGLNLLLLVIHQSSGFRRGINIVSIAQKK